ncbi:MAG TPA: DsbC family protein [Castellaniella sp.]|nr:DsbC family protein [Castellaniella sp.]
MIRVSTLLSALLLACCMPAWAQSADQVLGTTQTPAARASADADNTGDKVLSTAALNPQQAQSIRKQFEARFPGIQVSQIRLTPLPGIYEVQVGLDLLYTDADAHYVMQGSLIDARARKDLTAARLEVLQQVAFDSLPLDKAIRQVKGDGSRQVAVFEDPNCGYCKQLHQTLRGVDNVTVYTFLFPILAPDSTTKARNIWCSADPAQAWKDWMVDGKVPATAQCDTPIQETLALGRKLNVQGTPALFFADGSRVNGALPLDALQKKLDTLGG